MSLEARKASIRAVGAQTKSPGSERKRPADTTRGKKRRKSLVARYNDTMQRI